MPPQLDIEGVLRSGRILVVAGVDQQQRQPALLQHLPAGLPVLPRRLQHHLGDALGLQPVGQRLQARDDPRVGADLLTASSPTPTPAGRVRDADGRPPPHPCRHPAPRPVPRSAPTACHLLPDRLCWWRPAGPTEETMLNRVLAANSSWCREGPASISDTGSHAPMRAELGRASPFSSVVAANGHEISDDTGRA